MSGEIRRPDTGSARLNALRAYWLDRRSGSQLPGRRDIDPVDLPSYLATMMLIDGLGEGDRYRFRLVGTLLSHLMVRDPTSRHLDDVLGEGELESFEDLLGHVAVSREPLPVRGHLVWASGWSVPVDWMFLPLASDGVTADMVLACVDLPSLPVLMPHGRPNLTFSWPSQSLPLNKWTADGSRAMKRWLSMVNSSTAVALAS